MIRQNEIDSEKEIKVFEKRCEKFEKSSQIVFICRMYILNISNIFFDNVRGKKGILRIKNSEPNSQYKCYKEFDMVPGEINEIITVNLKWPVNKIYFYPEK